MAQRVANTLVTTFVVCCEYRSRWFCQAEKVDSRRKTTIARRARVRIESATKPIWNLDEDIQSSKRSSMTMIQDDLTSLSACRKWRRRNGFRRTSAPIFEHGCNVFRNANHCRWYWTKAPLCTCFEVFYHCHLSSPRCSEIQFCWCGVDDYNNNSDSTSMTVTNELKRQQSRKRGIVVSLSSACSFPGICTPLACCRRLAMHTLHKVTKTNTRMPSDLLNRTGYQYTNINHHNDLKTRRVLLMMCSYS